MDLDLTALTPVLASFADPPPAAVALARELARADDAAITRTKAPVAAGRLERIYAIRARLGTNPPAREAAYAALAATAARFADEPWHIYTVTSGDREIVIFASDAGVGRFALDLGSRARTVRTI